MFKIGTGKKRQLRGAEVVLGAEFVLGASDFKHNVGSWSRKFWELEPESADFGTI